MKSTHDALLQEAKKLGIPTNSGIYKPKSEAWAELEVSEWELHRRIGEEKRHRREHRLWIIALVSAIAAALSALASWWAVLTSIGATT